MRPRPAGGIRAGFPRVSSNPHARVCVRACMDSSVCAARPRIRRISRAGCRRGRGSSRLLRVTREEEQKHHDKTGAGARRRQFGRAASITSRSRRAAALYAAGPHGFHRACPSRRAERISPCLSDAAGQTAGPRDRLAIGPQKPPSIHSAVHSPNVRSRGGRSRVEREVERERRVPAVISPQRRASRESSRAAM